MSLNASWHWIGLKPEDPNAYLAAAAALVKLKRAGRGTRTGGGGAEVASEKDRRPRAAAHEMLARLALARHDAETAREEAALALKADPAFPMPHYVDARLLYDQGKYDEALTLFERAAAALEKPGRRRSPSCTSILGDMLIRLERRPKRKPSSSKSCGRFRRTYARAAGWPCSITPAAGPTRPGAVSDMIRAIPTPDGYALAARLLTTFGDRKQAEAVRAEGRRVFAEYFEAHSTQNPFAATNSSNHCLCVELRLEHQPTPRRAMRGFMISST